MVRLKFIVAFGDFTDPTCMHSGACPVYWIHLGLTLKSIGDDVKPALWSLIEINMAIICACIPAVRGFFAVSLFFCPEVASFWQIGS